MKVFCRKCKHSRSWEAAMGYYGHHCKVNKTHHVNAMNEYDQLMDCAEVNANNDCKQYEPNWFTTLHAKFKKIRADEPVKSRNDILDL